MTYLVRFFGTSAAHPSIRRGFACIGLVNKKDGAEDVILLDCGDGSVRKILECNTNILSISRIFITHLHSDHLSGLTQIIETMSIEKRSKDIDVYGPKGLKEYFSVIQKLTNVAVTRKFQIYIHELEPNEIVHAGELVVQAFEMKHTVPVIGYRIQSPDFSLAYTGDTEPCEDLISMAMDVDLLIHEATFLEKDLSKAKESRHSTPTEASQNAQKARVKRLVLTHVSDKHESEKEMIEEARKVHLETQVAHDGLEITL